jgi:hypothetical protein
VYGDGSITAGEESSASGAPAVNPVDTNGLLESACGSALRYTVVVVVTLTVRGGFGELGAPAPPAGSTILVTVMVLATPIF